MVMLYDSCSICSYAVGPRHPRRGRFSPPACPVVPHGFLKEASRCVIETALDVAFDEPFGPVPCIMDFCQGRLASPFRSETMAVVRKLWLIVGFQDRTDYILNHFW